MECDVFVIGAGPAGMMAGIFAAKAGAKVAIADGNTVVGRKLLRTGGGRCNLTHTGDAKDFVKAYGQFGRFLKHSLYEFGADDVRKFFGELGLATKVEKNGCVYPMTDRATDVARILQDCGRRLGITFFYGKKVEGVEKVSRGFEVTVGNECVGSKTLVVATGGVSYSFTGSTGDGFELAEGCGHQIVSPKAALVRLIAKDDWPSELQGISLGDVELTAKFNDKKVKARGAIMFTDDGIGGPVGFDMSRLLADDMAAGAGEIEMSIDMMPSIGADELDKILIEKCSASANKELARVLTETLPRAMVLKLCDWVEPEVTILAGQLAKGKRKELVRLMKRLGVTITGTRPMEEATVTRGGVSTEQIDRKTMESKLCDGMFFAGEVIDADGPCGGYNLQIAWSTGALAGKNAVKR